MDTEDIRVRFEESDRRNRALVRSNRRWAALAGLSLALSACLAAWGGPGLLQAQESPATGKARPAGTYECIHDTKYFNNLMEAAKEQGTLLAGSRVRAILEGGRARITIIAEVNASDLKRLD